VERVTGEVDGCELFVGDFDSFGVVVLVESGVDVESGAVTLVAAFNGGFKMPVAEGGYYTQGTWVVPPRTGAATLVIQSDGTATLGAWGRDVRMTQNVVAVRQNLHLLVAVGRPAPDAGIVADWGATVGGLSSTWRSGLGVTRSGALVYVSGPELDPLSLADLLIRAGAIRGMELDINGRGRLSRGAIRASQLGGRSPPP
jgi:hypothetical protein